MSVYVLGLNLSHDPSACIIKDGIPLVAINEERLNRIKKYHMPKDRDGFFWRSIAPLSLNYCLDYAGININDIDCIVCSTIWVDDTRKNIQRQLTVEDIHSQLKIKDKNKIHIITHHLSHSASAYFASGFEHSAILVVDGWGSIVDEEESLRIEATSFYYGVDNKITLLKKLSEPYSTSDFDYTISLGALYTSITRYIGFRNTEEGKTMGIAPYGRASGLLELFKTQYFLNDRDSIYKIKPALRFFKEYFVESSYERLFEILFGRPKAIGTTYRKDDLNMAYAVQEILQEILIHCVEWLYNQTGEPNLCLGGGVALNSVTNKLIIDKTPIKNLFIQPAATDDGCCLGNALYGWRVILNQPSKWRMKNAFLGRPYTKDEISQSVRSRNGVTILKKGNVEEESARLLSKGYILGWFQGGSEFGPRSLGHRSIITDSRGEKTKDILNKRVKHRESFRPFAPSVPLENTKKYFDLDLESPYMLIVAPVLPNKIKEVPAITHIDNTARVQTITEEENDSYYRMVKKFGEITGTPVILNTSFNIAGEPIVETPDDAIRTFLSTNIDYLVIEDYLLGKNLWGRFRGWFIDKFRMTRNKIRKKLKNRKEMKKRNRWESHFTFVYDNINKNKLPYFLFNQPEYIVSLYKENIIRIREENSDNYSILLPFPVRVVWRIPAGNNYKFLFKLGLEFDVLTEPLNIFILHIVDNETYLIYKREVVDTGFNNFNISCDIPHSSLTSNVQLGLVIFGYRKDRVKINLIQPQLIK
ncbi:MAG: carbamoyltransferase C-terminal domain-containing protein [Candidatus Hydrogenedentota bacterium]